MDSEQPLQNPDARFDGSVALRFVGLWLLFEALQAEFAEGQRTQCCDCSFVIDLQDELTPEAEAADALDGALCCCAFVEHRALAWYNPGLDCSALALFHYQKCDDLFLVVSPEEAVVHHHFVHCVVVVFHAAVGWVVAAAGDADVAPTAVR